MPRPAEAGKLKGRISFNWYAPYCCLQTQTNTGKIIPSL